jgi:hypothetical protein
MASVVPNSSRLRSSGMSVSLLRSLESDAGYKHFAPGGTVALKTSGKPETVSQLVLIFCSA